MAQVTFTALEYGCDGAFAAARYRFAGSESSGWELSRNDAPYCSLGAGYRLYAVRRCGICATDLARRHLPFPLPQIIGHEVVADDAVDATGSPEGLDRALCLSRREVHLKSTTGRPYHGLAAHGLSFLMSH